MGMFEEISGEQRVQTIGYRPQDVDSVMVDYSLQSIGNSDTRYLAGVMQPAITSKNIAGVELASNDVSFIPISGRLNTLPYHTIPYHAMPCHTIPHYTTLYHTLPCQVMPYHTTPHHTIYCKIILIVHCFLPPGKGVCLSSEMKCDNGECINRLWKCDGEINCADGSDEVDCGTYDDEVDHNHTGVKVPVFMRHAGL